uniref:IF rod domain-containing protein n=1 Tax=Cyclopterus lumpus TaxID=8103 RepID=A0A8C3A0S9_CYCLU
CSLYRPAPCGSAPSHPAAIMPSHTAASMFGGAGGRGSRVSVASLMGLRNVLRNETDRDSAPAAHAEPPADAAAPAEPPAGDKHTLRSLNDRLSGYLLRARQLEKENQDLENEIDGILAKRKTLEVRDWNEVEKPLDNLNKQVYIAMDNAKLLLQIGNNNLANEDFKKKLDDEKKAGKELEKDLQDLKNTREDSNLNNTQIKREIDLVKEDLARLEQEHKEEVDVLLEKVKDSEVKVEMESRSSDLGEVVNKIRYQYDKLAKKNLEDTEEWYQNKVAEAQNNEHLESGKSELKGLHVEKRALEIKLQGFLSKVNTSLFTRFGDRLGPLNQTILHLEAELKELRAQVERHAENNRNLLCVKMKLEAEMDNYQRLMQGITAEAER